MKWTPKWLLPWPSRTERKASICRAEAETAESRRKVQQSRQVSEDLRRILARNHFAQTILEGLMNQPRGKDRP